MKRPSSLALVATLAPLLGLGCHEPVTEVVLVLTSDLSVPRDADSVTVNAAQGFDPPQQFNGIGTGNLLGTFPMSVGFTSGGATGVFSTTIQLNKISSVTLPSLVVIRTVTGIRFVPDEIRMLVVPFLAVCACHGTSCPNPGTNPDCDTLANPATVPFDPTVAPPSSTPFGQINTGLPGTP